MSGRFSTSKGIIELDAKTKETTLYGKNKGVDITYVLGWGYARKNSEVLFGDTAGYFSFNDQLLKQNIPAPGINITNFSLANTMSGSAKGNFSKLISQQKDIRLSHDQNVFSFQFSSVDFISAHEDTRCCICWKIMMKTGGRATMSNLLITLMYHRANMFLR